MDAVDSSESDFRVAAAGKLLFSCAEWWGPKGKASRSLEGQHQKGLRGEKHESSHPRSVQLSTARSVTSLNQFPSEPLALGTPGEQTHGMASGFRISMIQRCNLHAFVFLPAAAGGFTVWGVGVLCQRGQSQPCPSESRAASRVVWARLGWPERSGQRCAKESPSPPCVAQCV